MEPVPPSITKMLAHLTAREQIQLLKRAFASAFDDKRTCIGIHDFPKEVFSEDSDDGDISDDEVDKPKLLH